MCRVKGGCLWDSPGPSLALEGAPLGPEAPRRGGPAAEHACPVWLFPESDGSLCEA